MGSLFSTSKGIKVEKINNNIVKGNQEASNTKKVLNNPTTYNLEENNSTISIYILFLEKYLIEGNFHRAEALSSILWTSPEIFINFNESKDKALLGKILYNIAHAKPSVPTLVLVKIKEFVFTIKTLFPATYEYALQYAIAKNDIETAKYMISVKATPHVQINVWPEKISYHDEKEINIEFNKFTEKFQDEILNVQALGVCSFEDAV